MEDLPTDILIGRIRHLDGSSATPGAPQPHPIRLAVDAYVKSRDVALKRLWSDALVVVTSFGLVDVTRAPSAAELSRRNISARELLDPKCCNLTLRALVDAGVLTADAAGLATLVNTLHLQHADLFETRVAPLATLADMFGGAEVVRKELKGASAYVEKLMPDDFRVLVPAPVLAHSKPNVLVNMFKKAKPSQWKEAGFTRIQLMTCGLGTTVGTVATRIGWDIKETETCFGR